MPSAPIPLEDFCEEILGKAQRGPSLSGDALAPQSGASHADLFAAHAGHGADATLAQLAPVLGLHAPSLIASAHKFWYPDLPSLPTLAQFNTRWSSHGGILVNNYAVWDPSSKKAAIFD